MLYVNPNRPVEPMVIAIVREFDRLAKELELPYFLAGAMSRDILLNNVFGIPPAQLTRDVDFAIAVEDWAQYDSLKTKFTNTGKFKDDAKIAHRLYYVLNDQRPNYPLDIIPFRGVEENMNVIAWRPDMEVVMDVSGYEEALASAVDVQIEDGLNIRVVSLPSLALLKLFAWVDRGNETSKDAVDLLTLFRAYYDAGNKDRIYGPEDWTLQAANFDPELAGACLLGHDVRSITLPSSFQKVTAILANDQLTAKLILQMARSLKGVQDAVAMSKELLNQFKTGLTSQR